MTPRAQQTFLARRAATGMSLPVLGHLASLVETGEDVAQVYDRTRDALAHEIDLMNWQMARDSGYPGASDQPPKRISGASTERAVRYIQAFEDANQRPVEYYAVRWGNTSFPLWFAREVVQRNSDWIPSDLFGVPCFLPPL